MKKLTITAVGVHGSDTTISDHSFKTLLNPQAIDENISFNYAKDTTVKNENTVNNLKGGSRDISFNIMLDATGAIPSLNETIKPILGQLKTLKGVLYIVEEKTYRPYIVDIKWGDVTLISKALVKSFKVNYKLFSELGIPLRAEVSLSFSGHNDLEAGSMGALKANDPGSVAGALASLKALGIANSKTLNAIKDFTEVLVKDGDSLPNICQKVYGNTDNVIKIAEINNLKNFRDIIPGSKLKLPKNISIINNIIGKKESFLDKVKGVIKEGSQLVRNGKSSVNQINSSFNRTGRNLFSEGRSLIDYNSRNIINKGLNAINRNERVGINGNDRIDINDVMKINKSIKDITN